MSNLCPVRRAAALVLSATTQEVGHTCHQFSMCFFGFAEQVQGHQGRVRWCRRLGVLRCVWHLLRFVLCDSVLEHTLRWPTSTSKPPAPPGVSSRELATLCADPVFVCDPTVRLRRVVLVRPRRGATAGAARRQRERRMRSWVRHDHLYLSVQLAVVEAGHSSLGGDNLVGVRDGFQKDLSLLCFPSLRCENSGTVLYLCSCGRRLSLHARF